MLSVLRKYNLENLYLQSNNHASTNEQSENSQTDETNLEVIDNIKNNLPNQWSKLSMMTKLDIIYNLCELRLQLSDIEQKMAEFEASELRIEPLGLDSNGNKLWYFGDLRLYEEKPVIKEKSKKEATATPNINKKEEKANNNKKNNKSGTKMATKNQPKEKEKEVKRSASLRNTKNGKQDEFLATKTNKRKSDIIQTHQAPVLGLRRSSRRSMANLKFQDVEEVQEEKIESENVDEEEQEEEIEQCMIKKDNESENVDIEENDEKSTIKSENENEIKTELDSIKTEEQFENKENIKTEISTDFKTDLDSNMIGEQPPKLPKQPLVEELEIYKNELKYWSCVCLNLEDWYSINEKYKASKKKIDQEISSLIEQNYLPEMPGLFQKAEKERMQRLLALAPKRQSQRLQSKQQQQKDYSENESSNHMNGIHHVDSDFDYDSDASKTNNTNNNGTNQQHIPLTEQERLRREEIAKQREERYKLRLQRLNGDHLLNNTDENSQSNSSYHSHHNNDSDFNIKNYFLMHKGII